MMKTYQLSIKQETQQREKKGRRWKDPNLGRQTTNIPKRAYRKRNKKKSSNWTLPPLVISILNKERGGTLE
jgi:hypothetical protein